MSDSSSEDEKEDKPKEESKEPETSVTVEDFPTPPVV
jgi:hypothetical protein